MLWYSVLFTVESFNIFALFPFYILVLYVLGNDALISKGSSMQNQTFMYLVPHLH